MTQLAITVLGHDRTGIIAETTAALAELGLNIEDSTMTLLRGHFAMVLVTDGAASEQAVLDALANLASDGTLDVTVREMPEEPSATRGDPYLLSVHGGDRPGIVSTIVGEIAHVGGNVTDLTTRLAGDLYVLIAECDFPESVDVVAVEARLKIVAGELGVGASLRPIESDSL